MPRQGRFIFLGTGTSAGVPAIACSCAVCTSTDPRDQRLRTGAAVTFTDDDGRPRVVLLDATPDLRQQALRHALRRCDAVLFTHNHVDHTFGLDEVRRFNAAQRGPVEVYAEPATMAHLRRIYAHIFERESNVNDSFVATLVPRTLEVGVPVDLFGVRFTPLRLLHGRLPIVGFRIEAVPGGAGGRGATEEPGPFPLAYCTDVSAVPPETWPALRGLRTLVLDGLRHRRHPTHLSIPEAVDVATQVGAGTTYLVHLNHEVAHARTESELPEGLHLAYDGLILGSDAPTAARAPHERGA